MRLVLDTNVVLSALLWRGTPYRLLEQIRGQPDIQLYSSPALIEELRGVLTRPSPAGRLGLIGMTAPEALLDYVDAVTIVAPASVPRVVPDDSDDDQVIAAAVTARADLIVSGDRHLLANRKLRRYQHRQSRSGSGTHLRSAPIAMPSP